jgi:hypothetical protein
MNSELEDRRIKALFQELRRDDEEHAPGFPAMHHTASIAAGQSPRLTIKLAAAMAILAVISGGSVYLVRRGLSVPAEQQKQAQGGHGDSAAPNNDPRVDDDRKEEPPPPPPEVVLSVTADRRADRRAVRHTRPEHSLISEWRSPTDFLLRVPGEDWLSQIPRLGEPLTDLLPQPRDRRN